MKTWTNLSSKLCSVWLALGEVIDPERCVPGSVFVAKPYQHIDILSACRRLHDR